MAVRAAWRPFPRGLAVERRDVREAIEVVLPFKVVHGARSYEGLRLSRACLIVASDRDTPGPAEPQPFEVSLRLALSGADFVLPLRVAAGAPEPGQRRLTIVGISEEGAASLSHLVRIAATGWLPRAEDLAKGWDGETPLRSGAAAAAPRLWFLPWLIFSASAVLLSLGIWVVARDAYFAMTRIHAEAAAVSAPRADLVSHEYGRVAPDVIGIGAAAVRDQYLARVISDDLEAAIKMENADLALLKAGDPASASATRADIIEGRIAALERRRQALTYRSQCTCRVIWAAAPNAPVAPGTLIASLVSADPEEIRVEALVSPADALDIAPGQAATVTPAGSAVSHGAHVKTLKYEFVPVPKVGLGKREGFVTAVLAIDGDVSQLVPGTPADVVIWK